MLTLVHPKLIIWLIVEVSCRAFPCNNNLRISIRLASVLVLLISAAHWFAFYLKQEKNIIFYLFLLEVQLSASTFVFLTGDMMDRYINGMCVLCSGTAQKNI